MLDRSFVTEVAEKVYGLNLSVLEPLDDLGLDWRGLFHVQDAQGWRWVLRMYRLPDITSSLTETARLLSWLAAQDYPVPRVCPTLDQQLVGVCDDWSMLALSYIDGTVIDAQPEPLGRLAEALGHLHALSLPVAHTFAHSRCHPNALETTVSTLATYGERLPESSQPLVAELHAATLRLHHHLGPDRCITHGDCWFRNAVGTLPGDVVLIDWDRAGIGHPLLDLAYLLFSSHFDLRQPLVVTPSEPIVAAIFRGYQRYYPIAPEAQVLLGDAMRFLLAFQLGEYAADETRVSLPDFPFVLRKLQARADAVDGIAAIAAQSMASTPQRGNQQSLRRAVE
jgi:Ser/Thr protein kinase RdoA (MazF antagonist)